MRWAILLQKYELDVEYIEGKANVIADCASRMPLREWIGLLDEAAFNLTAEIPATNMILAAYDEWKAAKDRDVMSHLCEACREVSEQGGAILCDRCNRTWHLGCLDMEVVPLGYWYC